MRSYREVLAIREVWTTILLSALTRLPIFGLTMLITLHVVETLGMSYRLAGAVTTFVTISSMISAPWRGSMTDRRGLRRTMIPSIVVMTAVYAVAPWLGYYPLLVILALGYLWNYPIYTIPHQADSEHDTPTHTDMTHPDHDNQHIRRSRGLTVTGMTLNAGSKWAFHGRLLNVMGMVGCSWCA